MELRVLHPAPADGYEPDKYKVDIVAVHGLGGDLISTWTHPQSCSLWLKEWLPTDVPGARVMTFGYTADVAFGNSTSEVVDHAKALLGSLLDEREHAEEISRPIVFITHSLGGIIVKQALVYACLNNKRYLELLNATSGIFFFGTPHRGSKTANYAGVLSYLSSQIRGAAASPLINALKENSKDLEKLTDESQSQLSQIRVVSFYETKPIKPFMPLIVERHSALLYVTNEESLEVDADHITMCKFESREHATYKMCFKRINRMLKDANPPSFVRQIGHGSMNRVNYFCCALLLLMAIFYRLWGNSTFSHSPSTTNSVPILDGTQKTKPVHLVPFTISDPYVQRMNLSRQLEKLLREDHAGPGLKHALTIHGLGGVGKTQLVLEYIRAHSNRYHIILWIDARTPETILHGFEQCAEALGLSKDSKPSITVPLAESTLSRRVLDVLQASDREWLSVFDGADDVQAGVRKFIPTGPKGTVIVTSQDEQAVRLFDVRSKDMQVDVMDTPDSHTLLNHHLRQPNNPRDADFKNLSSKLLDELGHLPLAIDMVAAQIAAGDLSNLNKAIGDTLVHLQQHRKDLLDSQWSKGLSSYEKTVWTVWDVTLQTIDKRYPSHCARELLHIMTFMDRENIHTEVFRLASLGILTIFSSIAPDAFLPYPECIKDFLSVGPTQLWNSHAFEETTRILVRYHLIRRTNDIWPGFRMHRLVQWRVTQAQSDCIRTWYVLFFAAASFQTEQEEDENFFRRHLVLHAPKYSFVSQILPHITEIFTTSICSTIGSLHLDKGEPEEAEAFLQDAYETFLKFLDINDSRTVAASRALAWAYQVQGNFKQAVDLLVKHVECYPICLNANDGQTLETMNHIAMAIYGQGNLAEAESILDQIVQVSKKHFGPDHDTAYRATTNLAMIYKNQDRLREAEDSLLYLLAAAKTARGSEDEIALMTDRLAEVYGKQGHFEKAKEMSKRSTKLYRKVARPDNRSRIKAIANLAYHYSRAGDVEKAATIFSDLLQSCISALGERHQVTLKIMSMLKDTYRNMNHSKELDTEIGRQNLYQQAFTGRSDDMLISQGRLVRAYARSGRLEEAETLALQILPRVREVFGVEDFESLQLAENLLAIFMSRGKLSEAERLAEETTDDAVLNIGSLREIQGLINNRIELYECLGEADKADSLVTKVQQIEASTYCKSEQADSLCDAGDDY